MSVPFAFTGLDTGDIAPLFATDGSDPNLILAGLPSDLPAVFNVKPPAGAFCLDWIQLSATAACRVALGVYATRANRFFELTRVFLPAGGTVPLRFDTPLYFPCDNTVVPAIKMIADSGAAVPLAGHISISNVQQFGPNAQPLDGVGVSAGLLLLGLTTQGS